MKEHSASMILIPYWKYENVMVKLDVIRSVLDEINHYDIPYDIILYSRNEYGISKKSNTETIIPSENSDLKEIKKDTFDNTLQNFYELDSEKEYQTKVSQFEKEVVYNDLKDVLLKDLNFKIPKGNYNIIIF